MLTNVKCRQINEKGVILTSKDGTEQTIEADTVVLAVGAKPNIELFESLKEKVPEILLVGDCVEPRRIIDAISDGFRIGLIV